MSDVSLLQNAASPYSLDDAYWACFRQTLHQFPELSGEEHRTAQALASVIQRWQPDEFLTGLGGIGEVEGTSMLAVFAGKEAGPTTLIRCELDALPILELPQHPHASTIPGVAHLCGHDGHMTMVMALGNHLSQHRPAKGRVVLVFQSAEETGAGAVAMVQDPRLHPYQPDYAFALHNVPGMPLGKVKVKAGSFNCASRGMIIRLQGKTSHAAHPENGRSPAQAMASLIQGLEGLPKSLSGFNLVTLIHANLGEIAFGTSPGEAVVMATLRTETNEAMDYLVAEAMAMAGAQAEQHGLAVEIEWQDVFRASVNSEKGAELVVQSCESQGIEVEQPEVGFRWSEDFGIFTEWAKDGAMFALGSGEHCPQLHNPDYDFPDALIPVGAGIFLGIVQTLNGVAV
ncbi:amidohydrolase [Pokkaliibacter sp. CJK22405]|uniref:amidohydrolase n=1 Tax=Pokkaliibacter sp. CJK22405 TaxID=3384615 RepID=UPI0039849347